MGNGIYTALSGAVAQGQAFDVAANNIANAGTTGFKAERLHFDEALTAAKGRDGAFVEVGGSTTDTRAGNLRATGNPLDLALQGDGYFVLDTAQGPRYTRAGDFRVDTTGRMVSSQGHAVRKREGGAIQVPAGTTQVRVSPTATWRIGYHQSALATA